MPLVFVKRSHDDLREALAHLYQCRPRDVAIDVFIVDEGRLHIGVTITLPGGAHLTTSRIENQ